MSIKVVQVGAGLRGRQWAGFVKAHPDVECVAIVEPDAASREKARPILGAGCVQFADLTEALQ